MKNGRMKNEDSSFVHFFHSSFFILHSSFSILHSCGPLAQRSEPPAHNRLVPGSNPGGPTSSSLRSVEVRPSRLQARRVARFRATRAGTNPHPARIASLASPLGAPAWAPHGPLTRFRATRAGTNPHPAHRFARFTTRCARLGASQAPSRASARRERARILTQRASLRSLHHSVRPLGRLTAPSRAFARRERARILTQAHRFARFTTRCATLRRADATASRR